MMVTPTRGGGEPARRLGDIDRRGGEPVRRLDMDSEDRAGKRPAPRAPD